MLEKIKKLLRLATSDNPHEAAAALERAQQLMQKHGISMADVELSNIKEQFANAYSSQKPMAFEISLAKSVADLFGCEYFFSYEVKGMAIKLRPIFIGADPNHEIAAYAYETTHRKLLKARKNYISTLSKRMKRHNKTLKANIFCKGWVYGILEKLEHLVPATRPTDLIRQYKKNNYPSLETSDGRATKMSKKNDGALLDGYMDAQKEQINAGVGRKNTLSLN